MARDRQFFLSFVKRPESFLFADCFCWEFTIKFFIQKSISSSLSLKRVTCELHNVECDADHIKSNDECAKDEERDPYDGQRVCKGAHFDNSSFRK